MDAFSVEWLVVVMNAIVITLAIVAPLLLGAVIIRAMRRGISRDREDFEEEIRRKLEEISSTLAELQVNIDRS